MAQPLQRVASRAHPLLAVRPGVRHAARHADVLPRRSAARVRSDVHEHPGRARAQAADLRVRLGDDDSRDRRWATGSTSCCAAATRRRWTTTCLPDETRHEPAHHCIANRRAVPAHRPHLARHRQPGRARRGRHSRSRSQGRVTDGDGKPVNDALVEIWQANSHGRYAHPDDTRDLPLEAAWKGLRARADRRRRPLSLHDDQAGARARPATAGCRRRTST